MKKFFNEFKEFAMRGNVLDMAIGVVLGSAFGKITTSLVNDVFMPLIGLVIGGIDLGKLDIILKPAAEAAVGDELRMAALGAAVVGRQGVDLGDARHIGHQRRAHRAS